MLNDQVNALFENEEFSKKFTEVEDFDALKNLFTSFGVEMSDDDVCKFLEAAILCADRSSGELSEDEMENVAGGFVEWIIAGVGLGIIGGVSTYKLRKLLNSGSGQCRK